MGPKSGREHKVGKLLTVLAGLGSTERAESTARTPATCRPRATSDRGYSILRPQFRPLDSRNWAACLKLMLKHFKSINGEFDRRTLGN